VRGADNLPTSCADCLEILAASTSYSLKVLSRPAERLLYLVQRVYRVDSDKEDV
jgi:hypothetical protein